MSWTKSGSVNLTNGSAVVYGNGTTWASGGKARAGDMFVGPAGGLYEVLSVQSNTQFTLASNYLGATANAQSYALIHTGLLPAELATGLSDLQSKYLTTIAQLYEWETSTADTVPITNPATGVTVNVKPLARFLSSLGDGSVDVVAASLKAALLEIGNGRKLKYSNYGVVSVKNRADDGGWACQYGFEQASSVAMMAGFGAFGGTKDTIDFLYAGPSYAAPWINIGSARTQVRSCVSIPLTDPVSVAAAQQVYVGESSNNPAYRCQLGYVAVGGQWHGVLQSYAGGSAGPLLIQPDGGQISLGGNVAPLTDNVLQIGYSGYRISNIYLGNNPIVTSDEHLKSIRGELTDAELRAWASVRWLIFRWRDAAAAKGDLARMHAGLIAQEVAAAFAAEGLDARAYGLWCADRIYEDIEVDDGTETIDVPVMRDVTTMRRTIEIINGVPTLTETPETTQEPATDLQPVMDAAGNPVIVDGVPLMHPVPVTVPETRKKTRKERVDRGERLGLRMEQCFAFEAAYLRCRLAAAEARIDALEGK